MTNINNIKRNYGWKKSTPDKRDYKLKTVNPEIYKSIPKSDDLSKFVPEIYDQGQFGSCTGNSLTMADRIARIKQGLPDKALSRLFVYANERIMEGTLNEDAGAQIRDGAKVLATMGIPDESAWPYTAENLLKKPSEEAYKEAVQDEVKTYLTVDQTLEEMKLCINEGYPFVFGVTIFAPFEGEEVARTGIVPMPKDTDEIVGGHAITCVGYDDDKRMFKVLNSWSSNWGDNGYCYFPYDYLTNPKLCSDLWTIRSIAPTDPNRTWVVPQ